MGKQIRFPALLKKSAGILTLSLALLGMGAPEQASAHNAYYLGIAIDGESHVLSSYVSLDNNSVLADNHSEIDKTGIYFGSTALDERTYVSIREGQSAENMTMNLPSVSGGDSPSAITTEYSTVLTKVKSSDGDSDYEETLLFSFPGRHVGGAAVLEVDLLEVLDPLLGDVVADHAVALGLQLLHVDIHAVEGARAVGDVFENSNDSDTLAVGRFQRNQAGVNPILARGLRS